MQIADFAKWTDDEAVPRTLSEQELDELRPHKWEGLTDRQSLMANVVAIMGNVTRAAKLVGVSRFSHYQWLKKHPEYGAAIEEAELGFNSFLEAEMIRRAVHGVMRESYDGKGNLTKREILYSDRLLIKLAEARMPAKYGKSTVEHTGPGGGPITHGIGIIETDDWYGSALGVAAEGDDAPDADPAAPGPLQGVHQRPEVGEDGARTAGDGEGPRPA